MHAHAFRPAAISSTRVPANGQIVPRAGPSSNGSLRVSRSIYLDLTVSAALPPVRCDRSWGAMIPRERGGDHAFVPAAVRHLANGCPGEQWARAAGRAQRHGRNVPGATPLAYQAALIDPLGRTIEPSLRRLFWPGVPSRPEAHACTKLSHPCDLLTHGAGPRGLESCLGLLGRSFGPLLCISCKRLPRPATG